jgi:hypothetical protein
MQGVSVPRGPFSRAVKAAVHAVLSQPMRRRVVESLKSRLVYSPPPPPNDDLMVELRAWLKPEVERLSEYLDRDLVRLWGYDGV